MYPEAATAGSRLSGIPHAAEPACFLQAAIANKVRLQERCIERPSEEAYFSLKLIVKSSLALKTYLAALCQVC